MSEFVLQVSPPCGKWLSTPWLEEDGGCGDDDDDDEEDEQDDDDDDDNEERVGKPRTIPKS